MDKLPQAPGLRWVAGITAAVLVLGGIGAATGVLGDSNDSEPPAGGVQAAADGVIAKPGKPLQVPATEPKPLIDPDEILSGGPPPDGIPPIDEPKFLSVDDVDFLTDDEPVVAVSIKDDVRAYPLQILTWHEIVNDTVGGLPVTVTFCPLCNTAYSFVRPNVEGEVTTFGTSGKLYFSNLVMYDRATDSYWPQAMGRAVMGPLTGTELQRVASQIVSWEEFRSAFPDAQVLSRDTGHERNYGENPYPGYDDVENPPFAFNGETDGRLAPVERILGVSDKDEHVAYPYFRLKDGARDGIAVVNDELAGRPLLVIWKQGTVSALDQSSIASSRDVGAAFAFSRRLEGQTLTFEVDAGKIVDTDSGTTWNVFGQATSGPRAGQQLKKADAHDSFWFDWAAFHPDTALWSGE